MNKSPVTKHLLHVFIEQFEQSGVSPREHGTSSLRSQLSASDNVLLRTALFPVTYSLRFIVTFFVPWGKILQLILVAPSGHVNRTDSKPRVSQVCFLGFLLVREVD
jgi:hypothetical protein